MNRSYFSRALCVFLPSLLTLPASSYAIVAQAPLYVNTAIPPNIFFLVDDSGSMDWEVLKSTGAQTEFPLNRNSGNIDVTPTRTSNREMLESCVGYNVLYYNPNETYVPWIGEDINGNPYGNQSITAARRNPFDPSEGTQDLTDPDGNNDYPGYFVWNDSDGDGEFDYGECPQPDLLNFDYAGQFIATDSGGPSTQVMNTAQRQNFANWYSYYRKREYVMKAALLSVIDVSTARLGLTTLHRNNEDDFVGFPVADITAGTNREDLSEQVSRIFSDHGTPLRRKLAQVGEYFEGTSSTSLLGSSQPSPILAGNAGGACQQNFAVLMSDGYWNGSAPNVGNADSGDTSDNDNNDTVFDGGAFADQNTGVSNTLADVAMHYYERDLNTNLANDVPTSGPDNNDQQHMVTYAVAFGVNGTLSSNPSPTDTSFNWPTPASNTSSTIDDMRHAAWNGRGEFLSAGSPAGLIQAFTNAVASIAGRTSSAAALAGNSVQLNAGSKLYLGRFTTDSWSGALLAYSLDSQTGSVDSLLWNAADLIPTENSRNIFSYNDDNAAGLKGIAFEHAELSAAHQSLLSAAQVDYLRGNRAGEGGLYRSRASLLGDIVNSSPLFTGKINFGLYLLERQSGLATYDDYLNGTDEPWQKGNRKDVLYLGANDGMLHAFLADGNTSSGCVVGSGNCEGEELFAYVPKSVYSGLPALSAPNYIHQYYVDGSPIRGDAYIDWGDVDSPRWGTALIGTLGAGGKGVFALDISDPTNFNAKDVLWDLDGGDLSDLGFTFARPSIAKLANGKWGVIFGNGYHSANHEPVLYIRDLEDGSEIATIRAGVSYRGTNSKTNGLSTPRVVDLNGDQVIDVVYAGDLHGNMWKFDLTSANESQWDIAYKNPGLTPLPLFTACTVNPCTSSNRQPIFAKPAVTRADSGGIMVLFGTGKYFEVGDNIDVSQTQSFYGINDVGDTSPIGERNVLSKQLITHTELKNNLLVRVTSSETVNYPTQKGWYIDLFFDGNPDFSGNTKDGLNNYPGERVVTDARIVHGRLRFLTLIPETDPCAFGGSGFLVELDPQTGAQMTFPTFDYNRDGKIDANDKVHIDTDGDGTKDAFAAGSGFKIRHGIGAGFIDTDIGGGLNNTTINNSSNIDNGIEDILSEGDPNSGRQSWIQLK